MNGLPLRAMYMLLSGCLIQGQIHIFDLFLMIKQLLIHLDTKVNSHEYSILREGRKEPTCLVYIPNLFRPLGRVVLRSPKVSESAECIVTLPGPPVDTYVDPLGFRDTDHAVENMF